MVPQTQVRSCARIKFHKRKSELSVQGIVFTPGHTTSMCVPAGMGVSWGCGCRMPVRFRRDSISAPAFIGIPHGRDVVLSYRYFGRIDLVCNGPDPEGIPSAEVLFCSPLWGAKTCADVAAAAQARLVIPIYWDNFFSPLERAPEPMFAPPGWRSPWIRRMEPASFVRSMKSFVAEREGPHSANSRIHRFQLIPINPQIPKAKNHSFHFRVFVCMIANEANK